MVHVCDIDQVVGGGGGGLEWSEHGLIYKAAQKDQIRTIPLHLKFDLEGGQLLGTLWQNWNNYQLLVTLYDRNYMKQLFYYGIAMNYSFVQYVGHCCPRVLWNVLDEPIFQLILEKKTISEPLNKSVSV